MRHSILPTTFFLSVLLTLPPVFAAKTSGCKSTSSYKPGSNYTEYLTSGGRNRTYYLQIPPKYNSNGPNGSPLAVIFHGHTHTGKTMVDLTHLYDPEINPDYVAAFPSGVDGSWQGAPYATGGVDDTKFTLDLLDHLGNELCLDTSRYYAAGQSNGGGFTNRLACDNEASKHFAAFHLNAPAVYNTSLPTGGCRPSRSPTPILDVHGLEDDIVPYDGGDSSGTAKNGSTYTAMVPPVRMFVSTWAKMNGCTDTSFPKDTSKVSSIEQYYSFKCDVQHYAMVKQGHTWMGTSMYNDISGNKIDESLIMLEFFSKHRLPSTSRILQAGY